MKNGWLHINQYTTGYCRSCQDFGALNMQTEVCLFCEREKKMDSDQFPKKTIHHVRELWDLAEKKTARERVKRQELIDRGSRELVLHVQNRVLEAMEWAAKNGKDRNTVNPVCISMNDWFDGMNRGEFGPHREPLTDQAMAKLSELGYELVTKRPPGLRDRVEVLTVSGWLKSAK